MELYIFRYAEWETLYNCSYDLDIIPVELRKHEIHGLLMLVLSVIFVVIYIPTLSVIMCKYLNKTAYQIMFLIGISDVLMLIAINISCAIMSFRGDVFCSIPNFSYITCSLGMALWVLSTETSVILTFYRCLELWRPHVADALFQGRRTFFWIGFALTHFTFVFFFGMPVAFSSIVGALVLNPHVGYIEDTEGKYYNYHNKYYNMGLLVVIIGLYIVFVYLMISKRKLATFGPSPQMLAAQRKSLIQALIICTCGAISDAYWIIVMLGPSPPQIVIFIGMYTWICGHGVPGLTYVIMNKTVRNSIFKMFETRTKEIISRTRNAISIQPGMHAFSQNVERN
ncbi:serpentine type 7TM GPCR chemoreceptor srt domain-containing protein [Ditylenchus destructor]|uniref:Serpentine type 7TM GPCR chemoreceptor srt domain-containing protein n=1 Tax=Ditylenchus destructor TaxID=166010 RepID=A0AAD4MLR5_9BILA|nr:serpentine type 7TM GPCR chemoreceptor srt domain-containing protein [Ditylenchus destructor]